MALLSTSQLTKSFGTDVIFSGVSFEIQKNDRVGLVGINGSGKTTLFKVLMDEYSADSGEIYKARDCVIGYMEQHVCRDLHRSAYHEVLTVFSHLSAMEERLDTINKALQGRPLGQYKPSPLPAEPACMPAGNMKGGDSCLS